MVESNRAYHIYRVETRPAPEGDLSLARSDGQSLYSINYVLYTVGLAAVYSELGLWSAPVNIAVYLTGQWTAAIVTCVFTCWLQYTNWLLVDASPRLTHQFCCVRCFQRRDYFWFADLIVLHIIYSGLPITWRVLTISMWWQHYGAVHYYGLNTFMSDFRDRSTYQLELLGLYLNTTHCMDCLDYSWTLLLLWALINQVSANISIFWTERSIFAVSYER